MKILHVDTQKGWRGGEQQLFWLVEGLKQDSIDTAVACLKNDELEKRCKEKGIRTFPLYGNQLLDLLKIAKIGAQFDIVHAHAAKAHTVCAMAKLINKKPLVYTRRVDYEPKKNTITAFKYRHTDKIVAVSSFVANVLKKSIKTNKDIFVIHSSANIQLIKNVDKEKTNRIRTHLKGNPIVGTVASLTKQKNLPNFINAAKILKVQIQKAAFVIVGEGNLKKQLKEIISANGLSSSFFLPGFKKDIQNYTKAMDVFILASDNEGFSGALLNAMLLKIPVVVTDAGGAKEVVINKQTGILIPKNDPKSLADGIMILLKDEKLRQTLTENAYNLVVDNFTVGKMVHKYELLYENILHKS